MVSILGGRRRSRKSIAKPRRWNTERGGVVGGSELTNNKKIGKHRNIWDGIYS